MADGRTRLLRFATGDRTAQTATAGNPPSNSTPVNSANQVTGIGGSTFTYDANGNLTKDDNYRERPVKDVLTLAAIVQAAGGESAAGAAAAVRFHGSSSSTRLMGWSATRASTFLR